MNFRSLALLAAIKLITLAACQHQGQEASEDNGNRDDITEKARVLSLMESQEYHTARIEKPWQGASESLTYHFPRQSGINPSGEGEIIDLPAEDIVCLSSTCIAIMEQLDATDKLVAISDIENTSIEHIREKVKEGTIKEVGEPHQLDFERLINVEPDLVITYGSAEANRQVKPRMERVGIDLVFFSEFMEERPLARAEWLKLAGSVLGKEDMADSIFRAISNKYQDLREKAQNPEKKPTVFTGMDLGDTWFVPGGRSYKANFIDHAGGRYIWEDNEEAGSLNLSFEEVYDKAKTGELWLVNSQGIRSPEDLLTEDSRYQNFKAFKEGKIYNIHGGSREYGAYPYWDKGVMNPHWILADLIHIFHPDKLPDHELNFYRPLTSSEKAL